jgi:hypothetical protein
MVELVARLLMKRKVRGSNLGRGQTHASFKGLLNLNGYSILPYICFI